MSEIKKQMVPDAANTYCNPLSIPNIPYGYDERMIKEKAMFNGMGNGGFCPPEAP